MKPLSTAETSTFLALRIQGLQTAKQQAVVTHLRGLGIPDNLIQAIVAADGSSSESAKAEDELIGWAMEAWRADVDHVVEVLNGRQPLVAVRCSSLV